MLDLDLTAQFPLDKKAIAGTMTDADAKEVEALQAADLLARQLTTGLRLGYKMLNRFVLPITFGPDYLECDSPGHIFLDCQISEHVGSKLDGELGAFVD